MGELKFVSFASDIELPFYTSLAAQKLDSAQLDDSARPVLGLYDVRASDGRGTASRLQIHANALISDQAAPGFCRAEGSIRNTNTLEDYRALDTTVILNSAGKRIWDAILDGSIFQSPSLLVSFIIVCFADLKKYKFIYHFGFPALHSEPPWLLGPETKDEHNKDSVRSQQSLEGETSLIHSVRAWRTSVDAKQHGFFLAKRLQKPPATAQATNAPQARTVSEEDAAGPESERWKIGSLAQYEEGFFKDAQSEDSFVCFVDPSTDAEYSGWPLRNLLALVRKRWKLRNVQILCYRESRSGGQGPKSLVVRLHDSIGTGGEVQADSKTTASPPMPRVTGWERTGGRLASKVANLGEYMDPRRLADQAVDLNLKLMKWRIAPSLDLDRIKSARCLLLGAGTLGSHVARNLMAWGVKKITFVDNGKVSYSNPVRQPLFQHKDCFEGGAKKAQRAAEALAEIFPGVDSSGHSFSVPMVGHHLTDSNEVKADFERLENLIEDHDIVFLLMDTRESRWLPTVVGKAKGKLVMNAALGFDSYVVMRHGAKAPAASEDGLGCYFCNDVVAPADSTMNRTLDQQCTVTRPGVSAIAAALLVEITVSVLQHPDQALAPASATGEPASAEHPLGIVPHQIRGFLSTFQNLVISGKSYDKCSACSPAIIEAYATHGWDFVERALIDRGYVEELSGLAEIQRAAEAADDNLDWEEDEDEL